ncbi:MAG TPA: GspE/PulE family protein [Gammaproteobacteria bacterium]|jgi:type II secretory ATPase GspE/PulE/Tfp pilus assembly ATPase PilB-like protein|nr:GspE/PulE family protein [Gammaproteobacteria bacterium]
MLIQHDQAVADKVNGLLTDACKQHISDIHIEPMATICRIRFRKNGLLYEKNTIPLLVANRMILRIKVMANLNIAEKRLPQDGRFYTPENELEVRVSTCPHLYGEKIVLRLFQKQNTYFSIDDIGLLPSQKTLLVKKLEAPQGLILITGPTGSGKTITLYTALRYLNTIEKNILSIEDPIEMQLPGITQIQTNPKIGLDFPNLLRTCMRQDPDILMIGEIRDTDTANIAIQAAQTGHLVLATLHTNNTVEAIQRLQTLGVSSDQLSHSLSLIVAQRLIRMSCHDCIDKKQHSNTCHGGYVGRTGMFEMLPNSPTLTQLIAQNGSRLALEQAFDMENLLSLKEVGLEKVKQRITDIAELKRVIGHL